MFAYILTPNNYTQFYIAEGTVRTVSEKGGEINLNGANDNDFALLHGWGWV